MYCSVSDISRLIPMQTLIELTVDIVGRDLSTPLPTTPDETVIADAITFAEELIDSHLRGRYTLPLIESPTLLRDQAVNLVWFRLYQRRPDRDLPESIKESYRGTLRTLEAIRDGKLTLGIQQTQNDYPESGEFRVRASRPRFSGWGGLLSRFK